MAMKEGDRVTDPRRPDANRMGYVTHIFRNPACLMRTVVVKWDDGTEDEELEEIEFGPLED